MNSANRTKGAPSTRPQSPSHPIPDDNRSDSDLAVLQHLTAGREEEMLPPQ
jgi:hypothetical protein